MTTQEGTPNEAAERLREGIDHSNFHPTWRDGWHRDLDEALAAERRATVERIKNELGLDDGWESRPTGGLSLDPFDVRAILDSEAARNEG